MIECDNMSTQLKVNGAHASVTVKRDEWGIPHIYGDNLEDVYYVIGYLQAKDRLFQMDFLRHIGSGRLSEIMGESTYELDVYNRRIGFNTASKNAYAGYNRMTDQKIKSCVDRYVKGVNQCISDLIDSGELPFEYKILDLKPEPWSVTDSCSIGVYMGWMLVGRIQELVYHKARKAFGELADILYPFDNPDIVTIKGNYKQDIPPAKLHPHREQVKKPIIDSKKKEEKTSKNLPGNNEFSFDSTPASNNWVISGKLTKSGKPILCNDPHLPATAPSIWYEAHIVVQEEDLNIRGVMLPGQPLILSGTNQNVSWGLTNVGADVVDLYSYDWSEDGRSYRYLDEWEAISEVVETIKVRKGDGFEDRELVVQHTRHGPVQRFSDEKYALKWIGQYPGDFFEAYFNINRAKNIDEFKDALKTFSSPSQNMICADVKGNIGWWACGRYPKRSNVSKDEAYLEYRYPFNGSEARGEWGDWDDPDAWLNPPEQVPHMINPPEGYIVTANNPPVYYKDFPYYLGNRWTDGFRATRIIALLKGIKKISVDDMKRIQNDIHLIPAEKIVPHILRVSGNRELTEQTRDALDILSRWDYQMSVNEVAPSIFVNWIERFKVNLLSNYTDDTQLIDNLPMYTIMGLITADEDPYGLGINDCIVKSLCEAVEQLSNEYGEEPSDWKWGKINYTNIAHPLGAKLKDLNQPRLPADGYTHCVNPGAGRKVAYNASWRHIIDIGDKANSLCILPGGESGIPKNKHYGDQLEHYLSGEYKPMTMPKRPEDIETVTQSMVFKAI